MPLDLPRPTPPARDYTRCLDGRCRRPICPQCFPERAIATFLAEIDAGREDLGALTDRPVLLYHVPRSGGTFLAEVFERMGLLLIRPDYEADAAVLDELLRAGRRRGVFVLAHTAAAVKARHRDVDFLEFAACWRDPYDISASEYHGIRNAPPGHHLHDHHLRAECLVCESVADWVEQHGRANPISSVLGDNRPPLLRASCYAEDVGGMLRQVLGVPVDLVRDHGFDPRTLRPGRWLGEATREDLLRIQQLHASDYELWRDWARRAAPATV